MNRQAFPRPRGHALKVCEAPPSPKRSKCVRHVDRLPSRYRCNYPLTMTYEVHTTVFEGPFDLLLHLILN